jgi:hypothetical protein
MIMFYRIDKCKNSCKFGFFSIKYMKIVKQRNFLLFSDNWKIAILTSKTTY